MKGIEIACLRTPGLAEDYVKWRAAGLVLNPDAYEIVECTIEAEEVGPSSWIDPRMVGYVHGPQCPCVNCTIPRITP